MGRIRHIATIGHCAEWRYGYGSPCDTGYARFTGKEQGINKSDLTREQFLKHAWDWTDEHGGIILKQLRKLGCSCDWDRTAFTMDETRSRAVISVFCDLYRKGLIYRGLRMVNWDPERQTALSDEEVIYHDEHSKFYYLKYEVVEEPGKYAIVATTRPETIFGDVAVCINPKEEKNQWLRGKHVRIPIVGREIPIIEDRYVEIGFGTGCLKVTPAHDVNDYMLGQQHNLVAYDIFTPDAHINLDTIEPEIRKNVEKFHGMDRFDCRKQMAEDLVAAGLMDHVEDYDNKVGYSERTNVPIEPRLSLQWFIRMKHFADIALPPVMNDEIVFYPAKYKNTYRNWLPHSCILRCRPACADRSGELSRRQDHCIRNQTRRQLRAGRRSFGYMVQFVALAYLPFHRERPADEGQHLEKQRIGVLLPHC